MSSPPVFLYLPDAYPVQRPYPPLYGVCFTCMGRLHSYRSAKQGGIKSLSPLQLSSSDWLTLKSLKHRRNVTFLSIFYSYFHGYCSSELTSCMPPPLLPRPRWRRRFAFSHPYSVHLTNARVNQHLHSFIPFVGKLWNSQANSVFPLAYDLYSFKRWVSRQLLD